MAMAMLRRIPRKPARRTGEPLKTRSNDARQVKPATRARDSPAPPRGSNSASTAIGALRFHGHTSWQMSHPNTCRPIRSINSGAISPLCSMVRYEMHLVASILYGAINAPVGQASRHRVHVPHRSGRALRCFLLWTCFEAGQQHREKSKRSQLRMNEARVFPRPSQPCCRCQRALHYWSRIHVCTRFKLAVPLTQFCIESLQPLQQHLVIVARSAIAIRIHAAAPRIARNPPIPRVMLLRLRVEPRNDNLQNTQQRNVPRRTA